MNGWSWGWACGHGVVYGSCSGEMDTGMGIRMDLGMWWLWGARHRDGHGDGIGGRNWVLLKKFFLETM